MNSFLSCDWGTSAFRLRLVNTSDLKIVTEVTSEKGIASTYDLWQKKGIDNPAELLAFYQQVLNEGISDLQLKHPVSLNHIPVFISGMASSSIGMLNLPYGELPFSTDGSGVQTQLIKETENFKHDILLISGIKSTDDVMRGEETQLIGCISELEDEVDHQIFIFPGTHSKHIIVENRQVTSFKTYMTGELFSLLSKNSVLSTGIEKSDTSDLKSFKEGVKHSTKSNLLHNIFRVRTNHLFEIYTKKENFNY